MVISFCVIIKTRSETFQLNLWKREFQFYYFKEITVARVYVSEVELKVMHEKKFAGERLEKVRDIFLFCCYTGLAYADVYKLKRAEIKIGIDGKQWIFANRKKMMSSLVHRGYQ